MDQFYQREERIFDQALARPSAQREGFIAEACRDDPVLRERVLRLLREHERMSTLDRPPAESLAQAARQDAASVAIDAAAGDCIGHYRLLEKIGEGGCGVVFRAEQDRPVRREVALKIVKLGMDTRQVIARFEAERQALALMDHPHIARVLDAGATTTGRPFFVMELVQGVAITRYCDEHRLATEARLELFIATCRAVQHAHYKGIIHRDLKPSNILVARQDGAPTPKIIDFGVAKAIEARLTDKTLFTAFGHFIGTPAYMSPEQAGLGEAGVDTRSDIYSLGVVLYELLTGRTPFRSADLVNAGADELRRRLREDEPARPSTCLTTLEGDALAAVAASRQAEPAKLVATLRGDLDWVVMRCLEKDPGRRYDTVEALAEDIRRFLRHEPISAVAPSSAYVLRKLVRRHRVAFTAGGSVALAVLAGALISTVLFLRERDSRQRAEAATARAQAAERAQREVRLEAEKHAAAARLEAQRSAEVARFMQDMLKGISPGVAKGRDTQLIREIVEATLPRIDTLAAQPEVQAELWATLAAAFVRFGEVTRAAELQKRVLEVRRRIYPPDHPKIGDALRELGNIVRGAGDGAASEKLLREALPIIAKQEGEVSVQVVFLHDEISQALRAQGRYPQSAEVSLQGLALARRLPGNNRVAVGHVLLGLGWAYQRQGQFAKSEPIFRECLALLEAEKADPFSIRARQAVHTQLGYTLAELARLQPEKYPEAESTLRQALALDREYFGSEHPEIGQAQRKIGNLMIDLGRFSEAETSYREALEVFKRLFAREPTNNVYATQVVVTMIPMANAVLLQHRPAEAERYLSEAIGLVREVVPKNRGPLAEALGLLGRSLVELGRPTQAEAAYREAFAIGLAGAYDSVTEAMTGLDALLKSKGRTTEADELWRQLIARCGQLTDQRADGVFVVRVISSLISCQRGATAEALAREHLAKWKTSRPDDWHVSAFEVLCGNALVAQARFAEAETLLIEGCPTLASHLADMSPSVPSELCRPLKNLVELYTHWNLPARAKEWEQKHAATQRRGTR